MRLRLPLILLLAGLLAAQQLAAQSVPLNSTNIPFSDATGQLLKHPQLGGLNSPQFNGIDLNNDQVEDMVVFDRKGNILLPFLFENGDYRYAPEYIDKFPPIRYFMLTHDYNCDGIKDLFCYPTQIAIDGLEVYTAGYDANGDIEFTQYLFPDYFFDIINYPGTNNFPSNLAVLRSDIPAIADFDGDGDSDIVTFDIVGSYLYYIENKSMDRGYGCDSLIFEKEGDCWGRFAETGVTAALELSPSPDSCVGRMWFENGGRQRHAGSTLTAIDIDNDGDQDMILGDISFPDVVLAINGGNKDTAWINAQETDFPTNTIPAKLPDFPASFLLDIDNDGDRDLIASRNEDSDATENYYVSFYYENTGSDTLPVFSFQTDAYLVEEMIDLGTYAAPCFFDHNGDGLLDLLIGSLGRYQSGGITHGLLALYENVGSVDSPAFQLITEDYLNISALGLRRLAPGAGDVDNDGDIDLLIGEEYGTLVYYENTAGAGNPPNLSGPVLNYQGLDAIQASVPQIIDVDRDGKNDLIVGQNQGFVYYYRNTSTTSVPSFTLQPAPNNSLNAWGDVDARPIGFSQGYAAPRLVDINGNYELFVGNIGGRIMHFDDIETSTTGSFTRTTDFFGEIDPGTNAVLDIVDLNQDGDLEFAVGNGRGGITIYSQGQLTPVVRIDAPQPQLAQLYPNPAHHQLVIETSQDQGYTLRIFNMMGQQLQAERHINRTQLLLNTRQWTPGIYFLQLHFETHTETHKVVIQH